MSIYLTRYFCSPFSAPDVPRRQKYVATDTIYVDTPAIDCGHTVAQLYYPIDSKVCDIYKLKTDKTIH